MQHRRLAEITEMIHTASLVHDDVLDECELRRGATPTPTPGPRLPRLETCLGCRCAARAAAVASVRAVVQCFAKRARSAPLAGKSTVNSVFGTRVAVLAGDYLFAQSSWYLANLDNLEVIKLISQA